MFKWLTVATPVRRVERLLVAVSLLALLLAAPECAGVLAPVLGLPGLATSGS